MRYCKKTQKRTLYLVVCRIMINFATKKRMVQNNVNIQGSIVLITGIAGFIGSNLAKRLIATNKDITIRARGYLAIVLQHEIDHFSGILFYDHINKKDPFKEVEGALVI